MREIKFRAWYKEEKRMILSDDLILTNVLYTTRYSIDRIRDAEEIRKTLDLKGDLYIKAELKKLVLMQYTGLKDKNGKDIYEGDIVKYYLSTSEVLWGVAGGGWTVPDINNAYFLSDIKRGVEVIGNIYENPKLLK